VGCGTGGPSDVIWESQWCTEHGEEFCNAILRGDTSRPDLQEARRAFAEKRMKSVVAGKRKRARELRMARLGP
jgi:hypothetical protein